MSTELHLQIQQFRMLFVRFFYLFFTITLISGQISKPIFQDSDVDTESNKFLQRKPELDSKSRSSEDDEEIIASMKRCPSGVHLRWMSQVSSSVYGTPIITDLFSDGRKEILVPSFVHYLEALESADGANAAGWPAVHNSHVHGSPFLFDIDRDGILDIGIGAYNGDIQFYKDNGERIVTSFSIPKLRVKKNWYVGLNPDPNDHSHLDVGDANQSNQTNDTMEINITRRRSLLSNEQTATVEEDGKHLTDEAEDSFKVFKELDEDETHHDKITRSRPYQYDYDDMDDATYRDLYQHGYDFDKEWDDDYIGHLEERRDDPDFVYLDAHILSTPVVADIDGDGQDELIVAVTYFFDHNFYSKDETRHYLPKDIDLDKYLAGGIVVFDLSRRFVRWSTHLDMTTQTVNYTADMFSSPTVLDIDKDGKMEIIVGNNVGFLYVLDSNGNTREGWPKQMGFITARILVDDLNGDGKIEILAVDLLGNVAMFDIGGNEIWERHFSSAISNAPTAGDVTGNGELDIVFGTVSGHLYVIDAKTGQDRSPFPFRVHGEIRSPITITKLHESPGQQLVFTAFDGFLYIVDGETSCVDARDIGEDSYSMVLVDDITNNGKLDLVVTTMNGNVLLFETEAPFHPLRTWTAEVQGTQTLVSRNNLVGVFASDETRKRRDIRGDRFIVRFSIIDKRTHPDAHGPYNASVLLRNIGAREMNAGSSPVIGLLDKYNKSGTYEMVLPCPKSRTTALIQIRLLDAHSIEYTDEFPLSFHMHWYKFIKWLIAIPFTFMAITLMSIRPVPTAVPLPS